MPPTVTDYRGHRRTLLPVLEINLRARALINLKRIIRPDLGFESLSRSMPVTEAQRAL